MEESGEELSEGVHYEEIDKAIIGPFEASQKAFKLGFVKFQPFNQVLPRRFTKFEKRLKNLQVFEDDIWIASFPKCGTTWTEEMVWCIMNGLDFVKAKTTDLDDRIPFCDLIGISSPDTDPAPDTIVQTENLARPRIIKTHLSLQMLPRQIKEKRPKLIYVARNPRDVCVSFYNHWRLLEGFFGSFETFADAFLNDVAGYYTPFMQHVLEYWQIKDQPNILIIFYEDMKSDLGSVIRKVAQFLEKEIPEDKFSTLLDHLSFEKMKHNDSVNKSSLVLHCVNEFNVVPSADPKSFINRGKTGNWRDHMTSEMVQRFEEWERKWLVESDLKFKYDLSSD